MCDRKTKLEREQCCKEYFNCDDYNCTYYIMCYNENNNVKLVDLDKKREVKPVWRCL